jgi:multidrug efflux pump subunit AcrB
MPIDVQIVGRNANQNYQLAREIRDKMAVIPGAVDVFVRQEVNTPTLQVDVDRVMANQAGFTQRDVANSMLISLSSSGQVSPNEWLNPLNGVSYQVYVQTPQYRVDSFDTLQHTPLTPANDSSTQLLGNMSTLKRTISTALVNHYDVQPVFDVYGNADRRDLGGVASDVQKIIDSYKKKLTQGTQIVMRGQVATMQSSFIRLGTGMLFAILLVYLSSDGRQFPVLDGSFHYSDGYTGSFLGDSLDAVHYPDDAECAIADGLYHGHRRSYGELHPASGVCQR